MPGLRPPLDFTSRALSYTYDSCGESRTHPFIIAKRWMIRDGVAERKWHTHWFHDGWENTSVDWMKQPRARGRPDPLNCWNLANIKAAFLGVQTRRQG